MSNETVIYPVDPPVEVLTIQLPAIKGDKGDKGDPGEKGDPGDVGEMPDLSLTFDNGLV